MRNVLFAFACRGAGERRRKNRRTGVGEPSLDGRFRLVVCRLRSCVRHRCRLEKSPSARVAAHILHFHFRLTVRGSLRVWRTPHRCSPLPPPSLPPGTKKRSKLENAPCERERFACVAFIYLRARRTRASDASRRNENSKTDSGHSQCQIGDAHCKLRSLAYIHKEADM